MIRSCLAFLFAAFTAAGLAQPQGSFEPKSGQAGKDVVWVPTPQALVDRMLDLAKVGPRDFVMDLGSGDGRTVITAAKRGARALGVEYNPDMVALATRNAAAAGVSGRATFVKADLFQTDLSKASVITMFLLEDINIKLRPRILQLKPGTRIVSNTFTMGDWEADQKAVIEGEACEGSWCTALLWIVPARVAGTHPVPQGEVTLQQRYQMISGTLRTEGRSLALRGRVRGEELSFTAGGRQYHGRMSGATLELR
jgi:SAM-dependent methyltransferase